MKTIKINKAIFIFFSLKEMLIADKHYLKSIKKKYSLEYDKVYIYDEIDIKNKKEIIRDKIKKESGIFIKIHGRKCIISQIKNNEKSKFLNKNHIQGTDKSEISYGIYYNDEIIGIMSFNPIKLDSNAYELTRFATKSKLIVYGIFMKTIKKFILEYKPKKIISFADLNHSNESNIYIKNNFKLVKILPPDYKLFDSNKNKKFHKYTYGNRFLRKNKETYNSINDIHDKLNLKKIWNSGMLKYELYVDDNQNIIYGFIYKIRNKINNKIYIGQTTRTLRKRIYEYKSAFNRNIFHNKYLGNSFIKYGFENFEFEIIDSALSINELNEKEINWIKHYDSTNKEIGYNIEVGGKNSIPTLETREKMSMSHNGNKQIFGLIDELQSQEL